MALHSIASARDSLFRSSEITGPPNLEEAPFTPSCNSLEEIWLGRLAVKAWYYQVSNQSETPLTYKRYGSVYYVCQLSSHQNGDFSVRLHYSTDATAPLHVACVPLCMSLPATCR